MAWLALHTDAPFHHLHKSVTDGQPQTGPAILARDRGVRLGKFLEQLSLLFGTDANAGILHAEANPLLPFHCALAHVERDRSVIGELAGIAHQVEENLPYLGGV